MHPLRIASDSVRSGFRSRCVPLLVAALALSASPRGAQGRGLFRKEWFGVSDREKMGLVHESRSGPFVCYAESPETAERCLEIADATYARAVKALEIRQKIRRTIVLCVWDSKNAYQTHASLYYLSAREALAFSSSSIIPGMDAVFGYVRRGFFEETLPHEITHIVIFNLLNPGGGTTPPTWLHEGLAQLMEGNQERVLRRARLAMVRAEEDNEVIPLWQLTSPEAPGDVPGIYYAEACVLADYLMKNQKGEDAFGGLCTYAARNPLKEFEHYFMDYYPQFKDIRDCNTRWQASVRDDLKGEADRALSAAAGEAARAKECELRGQRGEAMREYRRAFSDLYVLITDYSHVAEKLFDAQGALSLLRSTASRAQALCDRSTDVPILPGDPRRAAEGLCGEPQAGAEGGRYRDAESGLEATIDPSGTVSEVVLTRPGAGRVGGLRVGDTLEELVMRYGIFVPAAQAGLRSRFLAASEAVPGAGMDSLREGTYPVISSSGDWIGSCVRSTTDREMDEWRQGNWFYLRPLAAPGVLCLFTFEDDRISEITLRKRADARAVAEARLEEGAAGIVPRDPRTVLRIGDSEEEVFRALGEPDEREPYLVPEISASGTLSRGQVRLKKKLTKKTGLFRIEYPGLDLITWDGVVISVAARPPARTSVCGLRIGDPMSKVTRIMGSSKAIMKHDKKKQADELEDRENYRGLFLRYGLGADQEGVFKIDFEETVSQICVYATEWRGRAWGDSFMIK